MLRKRQAGLFFIGMVGCTVLPATPSTAEAILAVGLPSAGPSDGFVYGYAFGADAERQALDTCRGIQKDNNKIPPRASKAQQACRVVGSFHKRCVAVSVNGSQFKTATGVGWAIADNKRAAEQQAIAKCKTMAGGGRQPPCTIMNSDCDD